MVRRFDAQRPDRPPRADRRRPSCVPGRPGRRVGLTRMCSSAPPRLLERGSRCRSRGRSPMGDSNLSPISGSRQRRPRAILRCVFGIHCRMRVFPKPQPAAFLGKCVRHQWSPVSVRGRARSVTHSVLCPCQGRIASASWWRRTVAGPPAYPSGRSWCGFGLSSRRIEDAWISATRAPPRPSRRW